ncbi:ribonuclease P protein component [Rhodospirillum rubrum]|uniref:Ribonuclease P protein component n=1 Tax=Rhodospirillum rubrum (strain ATCC 11170 / ATH 1.1.1 / DSM 467 / LMG 4362 / NCIMB 8255 / S1) TaxID=269796 RepID=Q2RP14_RHORT|nr:ribonuclease P protein component [Rhodospirillum rubrum]ABC24131.1 ribonuclease P protein [Rhodospirillum rubrum ATCC 11170]AEO49881.1 ribonuclease P protein [Rhodospirillum rubrum F11]MBK5955845.1 ribonuclease P protein component [Rhodospirillum rubrum]QXG80075.1 ribonuclease P protein component [Rhodospirillum rubrum]HAP99781.1 ribonuclease P protein component [Rhodospirillum rubrum]
MGSCPSAPPENAPRRDGESQQDDPGHPLSPGPLSGTESQGPSPGSHKDRSALAVGRLKQRADFLRVAGKRCKWAAPGLVLQAAVQPAPRAGRHPALPLPPPIRVGFTTSKKVGNAVERNRARRRLRAAVDLVIATEAKGGHDYVVIGRAATLGRPFDLLVADLRAALKRLGMRR